MTSYEELGQRYRHLLSDRFRGWEVGAGWLPLVEAVLRELDHVAPKTEVTQIKEKFGRLRVYVADKKDDVVKAILRHAEARSATICEVCGEAGTLIRDDGWVRVRCRDHDQVTHIA